ncbi:MAG: CCA tRNA nucleotidyltransferase [Alphaproteobacteria bacterium]
MSGGVAPGRLPAEGWLVEPDTIRLVEALRSGGGAMRFVGGCVRDTILGGRAVEDIDVATPDPPDVVMRRLAAAGLRGLPTGIAHGTVTALSGARRFEVTTLRRDVETDGRHARVAFTDDWREDAARRDFTMNAMSADPDGLVHDYFGGREDLRAGCVRFVGDPAARIAEDRLRLLRFWRFHARYGRGAPRVAERAACRAAAPGLSQLSGARVRDELLKLLAARAPPASLADMAEDGILAAALGAGPFDVATIAPLARLEPDGRAHAVLRLAALLPAGSPRARALEIARRLRLSSAQRDRIIAVLSPAPEGGAAAAARALRLAIHRDGTEAVRDRVLLAAARARPVADATAALATIAAWEHPRLPVAGGDVMALGYAAGREVGRLLGAVEEWWAARDFAPDRAACLAELRRLTAMSPPEAGS